MSKMCSQWEMADSFSNKMNNVLSIGMNAAINLYFYNIVSFDFPLIRIQVMI